MAEIQGQEVLNIIVGRVNPFIYAFQTNAVPNSLKIGDTVRGVNTRLREWAIYYPNLERIYAHTASIPEKKVYFRDFSVHQYLENEKHRKRLERKDFRPGVYYSQEFFKDVTVEDLKQAIIDIKDDANSEHHKYQFYDYSGLPKEQIILRSEKPYELRDLQKTVIDRFTDAVENKHRDNLLMYAVMRFGKTFTALCCAEKMNAKFVVVVSAKGDVLDEWRHNVLEPKQFENFVFLTQKDLSEDEEIIKKSIEDGKTAIAFLTLQDLQGVEIKQKHSEVFRHPLDLLIIDETHFGARADEYGRVLTKSNKDNEDSNNSVIIGDKEDKILKELDAKVRIHLSGTPYNIIIGNEFTHDDIIAFCRYTDILIAKDKWYKDNIGKDEWENPYYGFPQMIRFAFTPSKRAKQLLEKLQKENIKYDFSELFATISSSKDKSNGTHRQFKHHEEVLELMQSIDGSKTDSNVLSFLDNQRIKNGEMCHHIVCVLPFRSSCDAMAGMLTNEKLRFNNLCNYEVINIAGHDTPFKKIEAVKRRISDCEQAGKMTISLTVNRMLTGCTVPQWDTMIFLKNTKSAQEYDQASFRIQSQFIKEYKDEKGNVIKRDMKPQTLLVDFDPDRMFRIQERRSFVSTIFEGSRGLDNIVSRIKEDIKFSPIISLNANRLREITPKDVISSVMEYSRKRSARDEAKDLPIDLELLKYNDVLKYISSQQEIDAKKGWNFNPNDCEGGDDYDDGNQTLDKTDNKKANNSDKQKGTKQDKEKSIEKQFATLYVRILFFAYLSDSEITSLKSLIDEVDENEDNSRIFRNLALDIDVLKTIEQKMDIYKLRSLDNSIKLINRQMKDESIPLSDRIENATRKFGRMSDSEIVTPKEVANEMVGHLPENIFDEDPNAKFLDIASKQGEFARTLYARYGERIKDRIYSIPTSPLAYEFTRKIYKLLGFPIKNIFTDFNSYDLIGENKTNLLDRLQKMNFNTVISNPPYQIADGGGTGDSARPIYNDFVDLGRNINPKFLSLIMPSRWLKGGKGLTAFRNSLANDERISIFYDYADAAICFPNIHIDGGICYFRWDNDRKGMEQSVEYVYCSLENEITRSHRKILEGESGTIIRDTRQQTIVNKVLKDKSALFSDIVSSRNPFGLAADIFNRPENYHHLDISNVEREGDCKVFGVKGIKGGARRTFAFINKDKISRNEQSLSKYKILFSKAYMTTSTVPPEMILAGIDEACTETFLKIGDFENEQMMMNCYHYIKGKFFRALLFFNRSSLNISKGTFNLIPLQDFTKNSDIDWSKSVEKIDKQLYAKYGLSEQEVAFIESMIKPMA